ncbi:MAG: four helix bundle protein [Anaerolineae bacterium]|nr:four helix bundle protein [Anaerolineae bacterium]
MMYEEWEKTVPDTIKHDPVWQFYAYRKALFLYEQMWEDCDKLIRDPRGRAVAEQLTRSTGSISANIEEGHGRGYGKDRNYFLRIAAGSARETKGWYFRSRRLLSPEIIQQRMALSDDIISLLVTEINRQREYH